MSQRWSTLGWLLVAVLAACPVCADLPRLSSESLRKWWAGHTTPETWIAKKHDLRRALLAMQRERGTERMLDDPTFQQWMHLVGWLEVFPERWQRGHEEQAEAYRSLSREADLPWLFLSHLRPEDDSENALDILLRLHRAYPAACRRYASLAVAFALVWDQPAEKGWPHPYVDPSTVPQGSETIEQRFASFLLAHRDGHLLFDPRTLSVHELVFAVDSPLPESERETCRKIKVREPEKLSHIYKAVGYDQARVDREESVWAGRPYSAANIVKQGGICMDQAYLAWQAGKAKGVPTLLFTGFGATGVHAWVGYLEAKGRWVLDAGRIAAEGYPVGRAVHPQTRRRISDLELAAFNKRLDRSPAFRKTRLTLRWARLNETSALYPELVLAARRGLPGLMDTWLMEATWREKHDRDPNRRAAFLRAWIKNFEDRPAERFEGQKRLYLLYRKHGMKREAAGIQETVVRENRSRRFDLGIHLAADSVLAALEAARWDEARRGLEKTLGEYGAKARGHLFYHLFRPYVLTCLEKNQAPLARRALRRAHVLGVNEGTVMGNDLEALTRLVEGRDRGTK